ncbi:ABC-F family ATP-binding cassette domain-containing protein [Actinotalea sp. K2]|uniref:ABC-F family ATP-binding cassette domain-containing protein n=1 Tax=Actinotalea sp. K2 TaxID=2939438 RepID=UPI0020171629|nr:ABC-F family ATP-binding cassette domain-containing protein [Actinotalea sp. K2]MCL3859493.1 ATP-binding cassette domain-containing protein [Actinotalea sp. K2]
MTTTPPPVLGSPRAGSPDLAHLRVEGLSVSFADRRVLTDVSFVVPGGTCTGLIGENGSGKSTLLRAAAGLVLPDAGAVTAVAPDGGPARVGLLHQVPPFSASATVGAALELAVAPVRAAERAVSTTADALGRTPDDPSAARAFERALADAEHLGVWTIDTRVEEMLAGLGLADLPRDRSTGTLSGGERSRLALAWLLLNAPDVLLLDEPTNHLDDDAAAHLREVLTRWRGPVLLASHDRAFLDESVTSLVDLDPAARPHAVTGPLVGDGEGAGIGVTRFSGAYTDYLLARLDARDRWDRQYRDEQAELGRLHAAVRDHHQVGHPGRAPRTEGRAAKKFYADRNATVVSRRVNDARSRLEDLHERQVRRPPRDLVLRGLTPDGPPRRARTAAGPVLAATGVEVAGRLATTSITLGAREKWLVTGANGSGKSTLLSVLAGDLRPTSGSVDHPRGLRIGLLSQDGDLPDPAGRGPDRTAGEAYADLVGTARADEVPLATFGLIGGRDESRPVTVLSVGQQRRLALAALLADPPDVLLLDEPTNHLSLLLVTQLEAAIPDYPGTVVVASHDRWLRRAWAGRRLDLTTAVRAASDPRAADR